MESIKDAVEKVIKAMETKRKGMAAENPRDWLRELLSPKELKHARFHYFRQGVLGIQVDSSAWLYHFNLKKDELLQGLTRKDAAIKKISFRLGGIK